MGAPRRLQDVKERGQVWVQGDALYSLSPGHRPGIRASVHVMCVLNSHAALARAMRVFRKWACRLPRDETTSQVDAKKFCSVESIK